MSSHVFCRFVFKLQYYYQLTLRNVNITIVSTAFQIFKTFEYLSRLNMAKCSNFSEIEGKVPLKRSFQLTGNENMVPVSESPTYPGSHLSEVFLMKFDKEVHGT